MFRDFCANGAKQRYRRDHNRQCSLRLMPAERALVTRLIRRRRVLRIGRQMLVFVRVLMATAVRMGMRMRATRMLMLVFTMRGTGFGAVLMRVRQLRNDHVHRCNSEAQESRYSKEPRWHQRICSSPTYRILTGACQMHSSCTLRLPLRSLKHLQLWSPLTVRFPSS